MSLGVIVTPDLREAQNYPRSPSEAVRVCREIPQSFARVDNFRSRKFVSRFSRKRAPHRSAPWARGRRARVCDHPELGVDAPSAPAYIRERSRALPVCEYLRQARQTTLGESGVAKLAECNLGGIKVRCTVLFCKNIISKRQPPFNIHLSLHSLAASSFAAHSLVDPSSARA